MLRKFTLYLSLFWLSSTSLFGQKSNFEQTDRFFDSLDFYDKYMGTVLISKNGEPIYQKAIGYADLEKQQKLTPSTKFNIGSISKMFTSVLIFQAVEEGILSLDQKLADFYPSVPNAEAITIDQLLRHRSGIANFTNSPLYLTYYTKPKTEDEMVKIISEGSSIFTPDSKAEYSNSNYVLLTFILEETYGKSFQELLEERITGPLKLENTQIFDEIKPENNEARSYSFKDNWTLEAETDPSIPLGAGAIQSTVADLAAFIEKLFAGELISQESLDKMTELQDGFGRGIFSFPYYERKALGHNGGIDGFQSLLAHFPEEKLTLVTLSNGLNFNTNDITLALLDSYFGKEIKFPSFQSYAVSPEQLESYLGEYTSEQLPLKFNFTKEGKTLIVQATGQPAIPLEPTAEHTFEFRQVGAIFIFDPNTGALTFKQGGGTFAYQKQ
ncbi:MAG: beta-lactamase family protein [Cyclobacteriaceae bacterium]|nr:beta-lactamase family protein [Cyclobacteriaceae bacterium]